MLLTVQLEPCLYCWMKGHLTVHCTNYLQDIMCFNTHPLKVGFLISNYQKCQACSKLRRRRRSGTKWRRIDDKPNNVCNIIGSGSTKREFEPSTSLGVVTSLSSHSRRSENGDLAPSPWMAKGPFSENEKPIFFSSAGEEWRISQRRFHRRPHVSLPGSLLSFSILREGQGVSNLSPWRSYPMGSSFSSFSIFWKPILRPPRRCDNPYSLSQSSWGGFYKELVKPYQEVVIGVRDGTHQGAIQTVSEVHKVEAVKLKDKCKVDFRIVNGG